MAGERAFARRGARAWTAATAAAAMLALAAAGAAPPARADGVPSFAAPGAEAGPVTGRPLPRYVSLKAKRAYVRRGPSRAHRVDWVLVRRGMPLQIIAEYGNWRRVRDMDGAAGWVHYSLLRGDRTAIVLPDELALREAPAENAKPTARAEAGVIVALEACRPQWCLVEAGRAQGWAPKKSLWGVDPAEVFK